MQLLAPVLQTVFLMLSPKNTHRPEKIAPTSWHVFTTLPDTFRQCPKSANLGLKAPANRRRTQPPLPARLNTLHLSSVFKKKKKFLHTSIFQFFLLLLQIQVDTLKSILNYSGWKINSSFGINALGPLCLWQCFNQKVRTLFHQYFSWFEVFYEFFEAP